MRYRRLSYTFLLAALVTTVACNSGREEAPPPAAATPAAETSRKYLLEQIDDAAVIQLYADQFAALPLREKTLIWHLTQAALAGRDIFYDQKHRNALEMRRVLEAIVTAPDRRRSGNVVGDPALHQVVLDQHGPLQQPDGTEVRAEDDAAGACGGGQGGRKCGGVVPHTGRTSPSTRCSRASARCSSTRASIPA